MAARIDNGKKSQIIIITKSAPGRWRIDVSFRFIFILLSRITLKTTIIIIIIIIIITKIYYNIIMIRSISRTPTVVVLLLLLLSCTRTRLYFNDNKIYTYHYAVYACATASSSHAVVLYTRYIWYIVSDLGHPRPSLDHIYIYILCDICIYTRCIRTYLEI